MRVSVPEAPDTGAQRLYVHLQLGAVAVVCLLIVGPFVEKCILPFKVGHLPQQAFVFSVHSWAVSYCQEFPQ